MPMKSEKSDQFLENDIPSLEERVAELLPRVYGHEGPFNEDQHNKARQAVLERLAELTVEELGLTVSEDDETSAGNHPIKLVASDDDKTSDDPPPISEEQTQDDKPWELGWLKVKGCKLSFMADNQGVYVHVDNTANEKLIRLILKKEGQKSTFGLSPWDPHYGFYLIENITETEMTDFIECHEKSPNTHNITWS